MKSKSTAIWFVLAAALAAFIWVYQTWLRPAPPVVAPLLPHFHAADLTAIQVSPAGAREISAVRTNGVWQLVKPLAYPAQTAAIELLAGALEKLVPAARLTAAAMRGHTNTDAEFGFGNPQFSLLIQDGGQQRQLLVGNKTSPGDQVYLRVVGVDGVFVTDAGWLPLLPHSADDWRDTALMDGAGECNWIIITNGTRAMEFRRDGTNDAWRMIRPLQARADGTKLATAFQQLRAGQATRFVTDDPHADLSGYGLQPADLSVWLGHGTNLDAGVEAGKSSPDDPAQVFARRIGWNTVVTVSKDAFAGWRGARDDYRDPHLLNLAASPEEIEVCGPTNFTLLHGTNGWTVAGEKFPADAENVQSLLKMLAGLHVAEFVKDTATPADLAGFGLTTPAHQIILRAAPGDTNAPLAQLLFGTVETNRVFVKRADEGFVYAITPSDFNNLFPFDTASWFYRDRRIWSFSETNVAQVTLRQNGKTRVLVRSGENKWSLGAGSQGILNNPPAVEEAIHRLGDLTANNWVGRNIVDPVKTYGLDPSNLSITIELKTGEKLSVDFGLELPVSHTALAAVTLDGERWAFIFPPVLYQFVTQYLTIPPNAP